MLGSSKSSGSFDCETASQISVQSSCCPSWYVDPQLENLVQKGEINEIEDNFEDGSLEPLPNKANVKFEVANIIQVKGPKIFEEPPSNNPEAQHEPDNEFISKKDCSNEETCSKSSTSGENFQSAISSVSSETLKSDDCEYFSLDSRIQESDETDIKHKQNVIESFSSNAAIAKECDSKPSSEIDKCRESTGIPSVVEERLKDNDKDTIENKNEGKPVTSRSLEEPQGNVDGMENVQGTCVENVIGIEEVPVSKVS